MIEFRNVSKYYLTNVGRKVIVDRLNLRLPFGAKDQILPQLDKGMGQAAACPVPVKRIAFQLTGVGNVVADRDPGNGP